MARGIWFDALVFMWEDGQRGELTFYSMREAARLFSATPEEVMASFEEIIRTGVGDCIVDGKLVTKDNYKPDCFNGKTIQFFGTCPENGQNCPGVVTIINRRMSRDHKTKEYERLRKQSYRKSQGCPGDVPTLLSLSLSKSDFTDVKSSQRGDKSPLLSPEATKRAPTKASVPYDEIVSLYHEILPELPRVKLLTDKRKAWIKTRWNEDPQRQDLQWWREYFESVRDQAHLMGDNDRGWKADLEFLVKADKMARVLEKSYQRENKNGNHNGNEQAVMSWLNRKQA